MRPDGITLVFLTQGKVAIIDSVDAEWVLRRKWHYSHGYASRNRGRRESPGKRCIRLHCEIVNAPEGFVADHKNRNTLDNRRSNLRMANGSQSVANTKMRSTTRYRGVYQDPRDGRWYAKISINRRQKNLGRCHTPEEAAMRYDAAAIDAWGDFATLNFPDE